MKTYLDAFSWQFTLPEGANGHLDSLLSGGAGLTGDTPTLACLHPALPLAPVQVDHVRT